MSADDDSKNPTESEANTGQPDALSRVESRVDSTWNVVERLEESLGQEQAVREAAIETLREELEAEREARQRLQERVAQLEESTDLLQLVDRVDSADGPVRSKALLQHLKRKAQNRQRNGREPVARIDHDQAEEALHHPEIHRTTLYSDMDRVARWFDDEVCRYKDGELWLDLTATSGRLPQPSRPVDAPQQESGVSGGQTARTDGGSSKSS